MWRRSTVGKKPTTAVVVTAAILLLTSDLPCLLWSWVGKSGMKWGTSLNRRTGVG